MIVNLGSKKCENNNTSTCQLTRLHTSSLMSIFNTPEKDLFNVNMKYEMRKVRTFSLKSSSILFSCSIRAMYNRGNSSKKIMLKSYLPGMNTSIFTKRHCKNIFPKNYSINYITVQKMYLPYSVVNIFFVYYYLYLCRQLLCNNIN